MTEVVVQMVAPHEEAGLDRAGTITAVPENGDSSITYNQVAYVDISYKVQRRKLLKKLPDKIILDKISGIMDPGLNAIMGPSGSGKTSLLDVLADRKARQGLTGHVLINRKQQPNNFKCASAYVVQEDILMGTLSVRENLSFSASLRLPTSVSRAERREKVERILDELGLSHIADSKVGNEYVRGISGGQKKRTSIGMELIISPGILFLDEPTTGLDASTAVSVVKLLKSLCSADPGRVIIMSIHQPRYTIYKQFDSLTLLSFGRTVYHGPSSEVLPYLDGLGHHCEQYNNPADFILDVIIESEDNTDSSENITNEETSNKLVKFYAKSKENMATKEKLDVLVKNALQEPPGETPQYATNFFWQLLVLAIRTVKNIFRNPVTTGIQVVLLLFLSIILGIIFLQVDDTFVGAQDRIGVLFFVTINMAFINIPAVDIFIKEKPLFIHQNASGYYRVSTYFIVRVFCDLVPIRILPVLVYGVITYWMVGLQAHAGKFFFYLLSICLVSTTTAAQAFAISAKAPVASVAISLIAVTFIVPLLFSGFLRNLNSFGDWISWLQYLSVFRYGLNAIVANEIDGLVFNDTAGNMSCFSSFNGREYLEMLSYRDYDIWFNILALACFNIGFLLLAYVNLRTIKKLK